MARSTPFESTSLVIAAVSLFGFGVTGKIVAQRLVEYRIHRWQ